MTSPRSRALAAVLLLTALACGDRDGRRLLPWHLGGPDTPPRMANAELPFRYPAALYEQKIQGNVTLRLYVDTIGQLRPESTRVAESSGYPALDSAAIRGAESLRFTPARHAGQPMAVSILFPVFFRHPAAAPLPSDTVLKRPARERPR